MLGPLGSLLVTFGLLAGAAAGASPPSPRSASTPAPAPLAAGELRTTAEASRFRRTGRYEETQRLCAAFARRWPEAARCGSFGTSAEGRELAVLVVSRSGALDPAAARARALPVMLVQGGIHAGEIDGKDAGFIALREMLEGSAVRGALEKQVIVFVPVFNVDGHERFGRWNRPNQAGPEEMGWRTTAQNLNLNRDYAKADAPEMRAMLRLLGEWDPVLYVDLHVTDGAQFEHDVSNQIEPIHLGDAGMQPAGREMLRQLNEALAAQGSLPLDFYPSFIVPDAPASGFAVSAYPPRFSTGYWALRNRFALLVETHSWKDYATRVRVTRNILVELARMLARSGKQWSRLAREADERALALGGAELPLELQAGPESRLIEFRGYAYTRERSEVSGDLVTRYDPSRPQIWRVPLFDRIRVKASVRAPRAGYLVPAAEASWLAERLDVHGIAYRRLAREASGLAVEAFRASRVGFGMRPSEGRQTARLEGEWREERRDIPAGSLFVPIAQPKARLVVALLEPQAPDSFASWGFFNAAFEQKEYLEAYVADDVARELIAKDPSLAEAFARRLKEDEAFAKSPNARLEFFHRRHASWDERLNLYPVFRLNASPP